MALYELVRGIQELLENGFNEQCIDMETGEIDEEKMTALLDGLQVAYRDKVENLACYIKDLRGQATAIRAEQKNLAQRADSIERKVESLTKYLSNCMQAVGDTRFSSPRVDIKYKKSVSVSILDESSLPQKFLVCKTTYSPDKRAIKEAIKQGEVVTGAELRENQNIQIN